MQILKKSTDQTKKPIATVKPMPRNENNGNSSDLLGDILSRQNEFLKPTNTSTFVPKEPKKPSTNTSEKVRLLEIENPKVEKNVRFWKQEPYFQTTSVVESSVNKVSF